MRERDIGYYEDRASQERQAAASASSTEAATAHRALASEYEAKARALRDRQSGHAHEGAQRRRREVLTAKFN
jgi:hypothetical protein